ncbi:MAG: DUF421 domain-containing protein [Clostridiales bacterium]|nr:DUF421 domain-containing protein [Clostridiales bacterium]
MQILKIIITSLVSIAVLFLSTKIIGNKQMSQLNMFDYINGITIGSIAAELATSLEKDVWYPLTAIIVYTLVIWLISFISAKNIRARRFLTGRSLYLMEGGKLYEKNFRLAHIDLNEFLTQSRRSGYFTLSKVDTAILEQNGQISFLPKAEYAPLTPYDMNIPTKEDKADIIVITDGHILEENLKESGFNNAWLEKQLIKQKIGNIRDIFLAAVEADGGLCVYKKNGEVHKNDISQ